MSVQPEGEDLRKAIKWISEQVQNDPSQSLKSLIEKASIIFDLSPLDEDFIFNFYRKTPK